MSETKTHRADTYTCPACGGKLSFDISKNVLVCQSCSTEFAEDSLPEIPIPTDLASSEVTGNCCHIEDDSDFFENNPLNVETDEQGYSFASYSCSSCGAVITTISSEVSMTCPYCSNNMFAIETHAISFPDEIVPFAITEQEARNRIAEHITKLDYVRKHLSLELIRAAAIYVPYRLYDFETTRVFQFSEEDGKKKARMEKVRYENVPVDASSIMPDTYMDALTPLDFDDAVPFELGYAAGLMLEAPDETDEFCEKRARRIINASTIPEWTRSSIESIKASKDEPFENTDVELMDMKTCSFPVWLLHYSWKDQDILFAVNGKNGKCIGNLPLTTVSKPKRFCFNAERIFKSIRPAAILTLIISLINLPGGINYFLLSLIVWFPIMVVVVSSLEMSVGNKIALEKMANARKLENADNFLVSREFFDIQSEDAHATPTEEASEHSEKNKIFDPPLDPMSEK